jgi:hypothetical protein
MDTPEVDTLRGVIHLLIICFIAGLGIIILFALKSASFSDGLSMAGIGLLLAIGIFFSGGLLGFLFGIPRTLQGSAQTGEQTSFQANTNLEQISDWLTKILVGVGLTQINQLPSVFENIAVKIAPEFGGSTAGGAFSISILIFFSVDGFFIGYLWTRTHFAPALQYSDLALKRIKDLEKYKSEIEKQDDRDREANRAAESVLNPSPNVPEITQEDLNKKVELTSPEFKETLFTKVALLRYRNYKNIPILERTEKIFRALIFSDTQRQHHEYHVHLGLILIAYNKPEAWQSALNELNTAIDIRDQKQEQEGNRWYELYRAACLINLDEDFKKKKERTSNEELKKRINDDIYTYTSAVGQSEFMRESEWLPSINEWWRLNR